MQTTHQSPLLAGAERREFLEQQPTYWLKRCYQSLRRNVDAALRQYGVTLSQRDVLLALHEDGPLDQSRLRERLNLEQSSVSRLVDGLAKRGLLELNPGQADRRLRIACLTADGERLLRRTPGSSTLGGPIMIEGLTGEECGDLVRLLRHCTDNLNRYAEMQSASNRERRD